jgi:undecaprenyl diphosphate synthase
MTQSLTHLAIIMDGNGRWARARHMPRTFGHREGIKAVRRVIESAIKLDIPYLTLFGFSAENWNRPADEVGDLMLLLRRYLQSETADLQKNGVHVRIIGDRSQFNDEIVRLMENAETLTKDCARLNLTIALSYGGRQEILNATRVLAEKAREGKIDPAHITEDVFNAHLDTAGLPAPDLLIRTSGEKRISNFLLWQSAYTEFEFMDVLWPDFTEQHLLEAIENFKGRERRFGGVKVG